MKESKTTKLLILIIGMAALIFIAVYVLAYTKESEGTNIDLTSIYTMDTTKADTSKLKIKVKSEGASESEKYSYNEMKNLLGMNFLESEYFMNDNYYTIYYHDDSLPKILFVSKDTVDENSYLRTEVSSTNPTLTIEWNESDSQKEYESSYNGLFVEEKRYSVDDTEVAIISSNTEKVNNYMAVFRKDNKVYTIKRAKSMEEIEKLLYSFNI